MSRSGLTKRVAKLEQSEVFAGPQQVMTRLQTALNGSALRITGKLYRAVRGDSAIRARILNDVQERFLRNLSDADLDRLVQNLRGDMSDADLDNLETSCRRVAPADDTTALDAANKRATGLPARQAQEVPVAEW